MFGFFKKKEKKNNPKQETEREILSNEEQARLQEEITELNNEIGTAEAIDEKDSVKLAALYEQLGLKQEKLGQIDSALESLEKSLEYKLSIGDGYKKLMSIYNAKRAEAARNGDDEGIDKYMNKMDDMRQIAKKVTVSR